MKKIKVGFCGTGPFSWNFIPLFQAHPMVAEVCIAELNAARRSEVAAQFGIRRTFANHDELCASDVDAVLIFTERVKHVPFAIQALRAGKHVYSAVPAATQLHELHELVSTVEQSGLVYMMGETSLYYPGCVYAKKRYTAGDFGTFVYGEGEYYHDMADSVCAFYDIYQKAHGDPWRQYAGLPPMYYPTHSFAMVLGVTGARVTSLACLGFNDSQHPDECWGTGRNFWDNPFSNQTALCRTSDGGVARINEFRRVGISHTNHVRLSIFGTKASFEEQAGSHHGSFIWTTQDGRREDPIEQLRCEPGHEGAQDPKAAGDPEAGRKFLGTAAVHDIGRLPESFRGLRNGHYGAHQFMVDDFVKACFFGKVPLNNVWDAARYNAPGLIAHESAKREGENLQVPDFGNPKGERLDPYRWE